MLVDSRFSWSVPWRLRLLICWTSLWHRVNICDDIMYIKVQIQTFHQWKLQVWLLSYIIKTFKLDLLVWFLGSWFQWYVLPVCYHPMWDDSDVCHEVLQVPSLINILMKQHKFTQVSITTFDLKHKMSVY